ncbi:UMP kinase [Candidatus Uhrbacteria bacterium CG10_big_fil_rev_8_21_14_0_10_48_11]|uniref:UMP kinase n=1 Tax=Candidatus Uhrbacteria bacterium CG10_big_fil_rev_8_21_14_0_10_48_11 TaxID=1975037 RepID=A0A2M8LDT4_9BACT|nr:MAG: UMP kinase [Candidatus Uhrbacteria bacterium CG10_big_fil_rev_8_21_14_0_10_48_11]
MSQSPWTIISLGGSIIVPEEIDVRFLKKFKKLIGSYRSRRFVIICGGGGTNRRYNSAAKKLGKPTDFDLDWIGIRSLTLNAELVRTMFGSSAYGKVVLRPEDLTRTPKEKIIIGAAFQEGSSSDWDAVLWANKLGAKSIINLSNIEHVYTGDPRKDKKAKPITEMRWAEYLKIIGTTWSPRLSTPFDPTAAKLAKQSGLRVSILDGRKLANVKRAVEGKLFTGSILRA